MKFITWNVRDLGRPEKSRSVKLIIQSEKPAFILLQDSKLETVTGRIISQLRDHGSVGLQGGLISICMVIFFLKRMVLLIVLRLNYHK